MPPESHNPQTWNRYAYVTNNPVSMTDPLGLDGDDGGGGGMMGGPAGVWSPTSAGGPCFMCGLNNAALYGLQPKADTLASLEGQAENRYVSIITTGWDPLMQTQYNETGGAAGYSVRE
jgi:hypothetical protein